MSGPAVPILWRPRAEPLEARAVVAQGPAAARLARRLLECEEIPADLAGVSGAELLALVGPAERLPWVDGAVYLGADPAAPGLLLPATHAPSVPASLLERALTRRFPHLARPLAVLASGEQVFSLAAARRVDPGVLRRWLEGRV